MVMVTDMFVQGVVRHGPRVCALIVSLMISDRPASRNRTSRDKIYDFAGIIHSGHSTARSARLPTLRWVPGMGYQLVLSAVQAVKLRALVYYGGVLCVNFRYF